MGRFDADKICERELQIVEVLRTAQLRAIALPDPTDLGC